MGLKKLIKPRWILLGGLIVTVIFITNLCTQTNIGPIHPIFSFIKMMSGESTDDAFINALHLADPDELSEYRDTINAFYKLSGDVDFVGEVIGKTIFLDSHQIKANVYIPTERIILKNEKSPVVIYYHGGGFSSGSIEVIEKLAKILATESKAIVITPEYRLAPEHRYPAAMQDAYSALKWVDVNADSNLWSRSHIFVAGDSAGGNLAAVVALYSRDHQGPNILGQILIYPDISPLQHPIDDRIKSVGVPPSEDFLNAVGQAYAGAANKNDPYLSPLYANKLDHLPPVYMITAGYDLLSTEDKLYATRLKESGIKVIEHHEAELGHGFISMVGLLNETDRVINNVGKFIQSESLRM